MAKSAKKKAKNRFLDGRNAKASLGDAKASRPRKRDLIIARLKACLTDIFLLYVPILYVCTYVILDGKEDFLSSQLVIGLCVLCYCIFLFLFLWIANQTPGLRYAELRLVSSDGGRPTPVQAFLFVILWIIEFGLCLWIVMLFRRDGRSLHELLSRTLIVPSPAKPRQSRF